MGRDAAVIHSEEQLKRNNTSGDGHPKRRSIRHTFKYDERTKERTDRQTYIHTDEQIDRLTNR